MSVNNLNCSNDASIVVWQLNCRKSSSVVDGLLHDAMLQHISAILIQDPPDNIRKGRRFRGYDVFVSSPSEDAECCILVPSRVAHHPIVSDCNRWQGVEIRTDQGSLLLLNVYIKHTSGEGLESLEKALPNLMSQHSHVLLAADSNGHHPSWGPPDCTSNKVGCAFHNLLLYSELTPANRWPSLPTFVQPSGAPHWIDVTATNLPPHRVEWSVVDMAGTQTDHNLLQTRLALKPILKPEQSLKDWDNAKWAEMETFVADKLADPDTSLTTLSNNISNQVTLDQFSSSLQHTLSEAVQIYVPVKRRSTFSQPWWTTEISAARKEAQKASRVERRFFRRHGIPAPAELQNQARQARHRLKQLILEAKKESWRTMIGRHDNQNVWSAFKKVSRPYNPVALDYLETLDGNLVTEPSVISNHMAEKFFPTFPIPFSAPQEALNLEVNAWQNSCKPTHFPDIVEGEIIDVVRHGYHRGAPGIDNVPLLVIHHLLHLLMPFLLVLFNSCLRMSKLPSSWKVAKVIPVPKTFHHCQKLGNLRPISLIVTMSKILEKIVQKRLMFWIEQNGILDAHQFGFRSQFSTESCLTDLVSTIQNAMSVGQFAVGVSLDISAAFDTLWPEKLIHLLRRFHVPVYLTKWISDFVSGRRGIFYIQDQCYIHTISSGVPQGSPLSPLLFVIYMQDLFSSMAPVNLRSYADDLFIFSLGTLHHAELSLQANLDLIFCWCQESRLKLSTTKCQAIVFHRHQTATVNLTLGQTPLKIVPHLKLLGVWIDQKLHFEHHIVQTLSKNMHRYQLLCKFSGHTWGFQPKTLFYLFRSCIIPCLFYACGVWGPFLSDKLYSKINQFIRHCLLAVTGCLRTTSHSSLYLLTGCFSAELWIQYLSFRSYIRLSSHNHGESWLDVSRQSLGCSSKITHMFRNESYRLLQSICPRVRKLDVTYKMAQTCPPWESPFLGEINIARESTELVHISKLVIIRIIALVTSSRGSFGWNVSWGSSSFGDTKANSGLYNATDLACVALSESLEAVRILIARSCSTSRLTIRIFADPPHLGSILQRSRNVSEYTHAAQKMCRMLIKHNIQFMEARGCKQDMDYKRIKDATNIQLRSSSTNMTVSWCPLAMTHKHRECLQILMHNYISGQGTGLHTLHAFPTFEHGRLWSSSLSRTLGSLSNQLLSGHFPSRVYLRRFHVDPIPESCACKCGSLHEDLLHLLFSCPLFSVERDKIRDKEGLTQEEHLDWTHMTKHPDIIGELCMAILDSWRADGRSWGRFT